MVYLIGMLASVGSIEPRRCSIKIPPPFGHQRGLEYIFIGKASITKIALNLWRNANPMTIVVENQNYGNLIYG